MYKAKYSKLLITALTFVLFVLIALPAEARLKRSKGGNDRDDQNYSKPWSLQMTFNGDNDDYQTNIRLSLKRELSKYHGVRVNLDLIENSDDLESQLFSGDYFDFYVYEPLRDGVDGANLSFQYLVFPSHTKNFKFYWGVGPQLSVGDIEPHLEYFENDYTDYYHVAYIDQNSSVRFGVGALVSFGAEWSLGRNFSLLTEYNMSAEHRWYFFDYDYIDDLGRKFKEVESFDDGFNIDASDFRVGFAFNF